MTHGDQFRAAMKEHEEKCQICKWYAGLTDEQFHRSGLCFTMELHRRGLPIPEDAISEAEIAKTPEVAQQAVAVYQKLGSGPTS